MFARLAFAALLISPLFSLAADLPESDKVKTVELFTVPAYCEGVVFDHEGRGYVSHGDTITRFTLDGKNETFVKVTSAGVVLTI